MSNYNVRKKNQAENSVKQKQAKIPKTELLQKISHPEEEKKIRKQKHRRAVLACSALKTNETNETKQ